MQWLSNWGTLPGELGTGVVITAISTGGAVDSNTLLALRLMGVKTIYPVGGPLAVTPQTLATLAATPAYNCGGVSTTGSNISVQAPIYGQLADDTAVAIDNYIGTPGNLAINGAYNTTGGLDNDVYSAGANDSTTGPTTAGKTAFVVSDTDGLDPSVLGGVSFLDHIPFVLTPNTGLSATASGELTRLGVNQVIVVGGQLAVAPAVVTSIQGLGISVLRVAGNDQTDTAYQVAKLEGGSTTGNVGLGWVDSTVYVAQGATPYDALDASPLSAGWGELTAGVFNSPASILLTEGPTVGLGTYLTAALKQAGGGTGFGSGATSTVKILGGPSAVPPAQVTAIQQALG